MNNINESESDFDQTVDENLEKEFLDDNKQNGRFIVIVGRKGSGKSFLLTNFIAICYYYNLYDLYEFILPEYATDANSETYKFISNHPNTTIYNTYNSKITENVKLQSKSKRILYCLDDSTSYLFENKNKAELLNLASTCRHGRGITVFVVCHALKNVLIPSIRGLIDYMFIGAFTNYTIIKRHLYEENCSMMMTEKEFMEEYKENIIRGEHNFLFINNKCETDFHVQDWALSKFDRNKVVIGNGKSKTVTFDKKSQIKDKILEQNDKRLLELKYGKKYKELRNKDSGMMFKFKNSRRK